MRIPSKLCAKRTAPLAWPVYGFKGATNFLYPPVSSRVCIFFFKPTGKRSAGRLRRASLKGVVWELWGGHALVDME